MLRVWNLSLLVATFSLTILGTFLTRSGVLDSVHAFTESAIGPMILGFFALTVAVGVGLIGWRGDQLRSPGSIDSPVSREGAFLANNVLFAAFAFVVLMGTVFPLIAEALNGDRLSVGGPYFDRMTMPVGFLLLFLMAVAPALPWRKASGELLRRRLLVPAWAATITAVVVVALGYRGPAALLAFTLGAFAAAAALRQLVLAAKRSRRQGEGAARGLLGRANGGMVVHLGVVLIAVAFAASHAYRAGGEFRMTPGRSVEVAGHRVTYLGITRVERSNKTSLQARGTRRRRQSVQPRPPRVPVRDPGDRLALGEDRAARRRVPHARRRARGREHHRDDRRHRPAPHRVAVDRRGDHGDRHLSRRMARSPPAAALTGGGSVGR